MALNPNMYQQVTGASDPGNNLRVLTNLTDINSITDSANGLLAGISDAKKRERRIEYFYDQMLLDTIKLGSEHNVFLKYCRVKSMPKGNEKFLLRRWGGLTEHTVPLAEGVPPKSDRMASEQFEGTYCQFGRYMEFSDRVNFNLIDDVITHYSMELGDVAVRTIERLCREELVANAGENYPEAKTFETLEIGDTVGIADYRLQALKFQRRLVKPINGKFVIICSPEHIYDLVNDPLVDKYMSYTQTAEPLKTGQPVELFNLRFEETMLDDYAYGYTEVSHPGEYEKLVGGVLTPHLRVVIAKADGTFKYANFKAGKTTDLANNVLKREVSGGYIKDGSYIPELVKWDLASITGSIKGDGGASITVAANDNVSELPVHRSFMFGDEFIYKTGIDGEMNAKFYVKEAGSAGTLDPINQRQSVGFKINTIGFNTIRPEAMVQFIFVPSQALATYNEVKHELNVHYNEWNEETQSFAYQEKR
jgi:N4-gp56 family major capsid protein